MKVTSYGLFWRQDEIDWSPGRGSRNAFRLLGRVGSRQGTLTVADFRRQRGIYILFDQYGPCYVGLAKDRGIGQRLKDHLSDHLKGKWDRFSWFGFWSIASGVNGIGELVEPDKQLTDDTTTTIKDLEALIIRAIGPKLNRAWMHFQDAEEWIQIAYDDVETYLKRLRPYDTL